MTATIYHVLELVHLGGKYSFEPRPLNEILVPIQVFFRKFPTRTPIIFIWESPAGSSRLFKNS